MYGIQGSIEKRRPFSLLWLPFLNGFSPEISGLIKRQKIGWEAILTELMTIAEHFLKGPGARLQTKPTKLIALYP